MVAAILPASVVNAADEEADSYTSVKVSPANFSNYTRNYYIAGNSSWYSASSGYSISRDDFMAMGIWDDEWADKATYVDGTGGYKIDNSLTLNGISYEIRATFKTSDKTSGVSTAVPASMRTMSINTSEKYYYTIDVEDDFYKGVSFLGGRDGWGSMPYIRYNYVDGTKSNWVQLSSKKLDEKPETGDVYIKVQGLDWDSDAGAAKKTYTVTAEDGTTYEEDLYLYLYQINDFSVDYKKRVSAIDVLASGGAVEKDTSNEPTKNSYAYASSALFIGMTMIQDEASVEYSKIAEMKEILDTLPPAQTFEATTENVALLNRLTELVDNTDPALLDEAAAEIYYEALEYTQYEFETGYVSVTQNLVDKGFANFGRTYTQGGGSYVYYTGTTYYSISGEGLIAEKGWKNKWEDLELKGSKDAFGYKDNVLTFNGVDYEISVPFNRKEGTVYTSTEFNSMLKTETFAGSAEAGYYQTFDVTDGYYKGVSFLGGSMASNPYIRYVYDDNTKSDWSQLNYVKNMITAPAEGQYALNVDANKWTYANKATSDLTVEKDGFYLHQMNNEKADVNKKTVAIEMIARNAMLPKVDNVVDVTAEPVASTDNWGYRIYAVGMTLLTNNAGMSNTATEEMNKILAKLPELSEIDGTDAEVLDLVVELSEALEDIIPDLLSEENLANYNKAVEYAKLAALVGDEFETVEPSSFVNSSRAYWLDSATNENAGTAYSGKPIYAPDFKAMNIWDNAWTEGMTENVLTYNGYKYKLRVAEDSDTKVTYAAGTATTLENAYTRIPVEVGCYNSLSLLGGLEYNGSAGAVRLNYLDGTSSGFINIEGIQKMSGGEGIVVTRCTLNKEEGKYTPDGTITLHQYSVPVDGTKLLGSFDIVAKNAVIENGAVVSTEGGNTYNARWFGFGLKSNGILTDKAKDLNVAVNPDVFVNYNRTYMEKCGSAGISNNHAIDWKGFIGLENWKNDWSDGTGVEDNTFVTDKAEYLVRMDRGVQKNNTFGAQSGTTVGYTTIDIEDGYFTKMMLLGGATQHGGSTIGMQFNYQDGTTSGFLTLPSGGNITASGTGAIEVPGFKSTGTKNDDGTTTYTYESTKLYLREYEFVNPNAYKKVVSVSIPYRNVTIADGVLTPMTTTGGSGAYAFDNRFIGMTMITNKAVQNFEVVDDSKEAISIMVSAEGSDDNDGVTAPVKTLSMAVTKAKAIDTISTYDRDVIITLGDGEYEVTETILIDTFRGNVTIKAEEGANPVVKGSKTINISDMSDFDDLDAPVEGIKSVDLKTYGITSIKNDSIISSNNSIYAVNNFGVFSEGEILPIAEYPNNGEMVEEAAINTKAGSEIVLENENFLYYADDNLYLEGYLVENYRTYKTNSFEIEGSVLTVDSNKLSARTMYGLTRNWRIFNSLALLDAEGEWYLDKATMTLYYLPKSGETSVEVSNMTDALIKIAMDNVTIEGIEFKNTCGNAIEASGVDNVTVTDSSFEAIGKTAITVSDVNNALIYGNEITNIGYRGVSVNGGDEKTLTESGNVVEENTIVRPGRIVRCYSPAVNVSGVGNVIKNNYIAESKSILVSVSGSLNKIMYNDIVSAGMEAKDLGAVYGGRNLTHLGNEIGYNHIVNYAREEATDDVVAGIYLDDGMSGTKVYNNIIENADRGVFTNGGSQNTINNNVLINCKRGIVTGANPIIGFTMDYDSDNKEVSLTKYAELFFAANPQYAEKLTDLDLTKLTVDDSEFKASAVVSGNRFVGCASDWDNAAYKNGTENNTSDDVYAEVSGDDNVAVTETLKAYSEADIDTNDIGLAKDGLDTEIAWAEIKDGVITVAYVSTYEDYKVMAAVKDADGKLLAVKTVADGESFTVAGAADVDIFVFDSLDNIKPMTK